MIKEAAATGAGLLCFPETYLPGYPTHEFVRQECSQEQLQAALEQVCGFAAEHRVAVILPMDWRDNGVFLNVAQVISRSGKVLGYQAKNQLDPSEDGIWQAATGRRVFEVDGLVFGISICHEGFRYPETVRWAARQGAHIVFHPNYTGSNTSGPRLMEWGAKDSPYYEKAQMVRALENTIYFASSNYTVAYPESASAIIAPDGSCLAFQAYREPGIAVAEIDVAKATGLLAKRFRPGLYQD